jgi:DNA-binding NarL/FixJ family response regulator
MRRPRILLADDHELLVDGLRKLLEPEFTVVDSVGDGRAAVAAYQRLKPDLLLLDVGLPLLNGIEAARQVKQMSPAARILFVTMQTDWIYVEEALRAGGSGYVLKQAAARELVEAIRTVLDGRHYLSPQIAAKMGPEGMTPSPKSAAAFGGRLTARQREVLQLVAEGKSMKEIAEILLISVRTVEFHKNGIMAQLGFRSTAELTRYALDQGIAIANGLKRLRSKA